MKKIKKALISISNKENLYLLLKSLAKFKIQLISSGGTYKEIKKLGFKCQDISKYTGSPEILGGRVKTLHPKIHAGILNKRNNKSHQKDLIKNNFEKIDLVIVNFYPFEKTLESTNNHNKIIENIDVGGPTMVRAAAKNYNDVTVITNSKQYNELIKELNSNKGSTSLDFRKKISEEAFNETAYYDALIANYFNKKSKNLFPQKKIIFGNLIEKLRYGENPHQEAAIYSKSNKLNIKQLHGKQLSYNNYNDIFSALSISKSFEKKNGTVIIKHANPCGVATDDDITKAYQKAFAADSTSAFGGIIALNRKLEEKTAQQIIDNQFVEVIIAPGISSSAQEILSSKENIRVLEMEKMNALSPGCKFLSVTDGLLVQEADSGAVSAKDLKVVSSREPSAKEIQDCLFAWKVCKFVKSNAIVYAKDNQTVGVGAGQMSRIDSAQIAASKAKERGFETQGCAMASDAFFPFRDGIDVAASVGITSIIQPGGSIKDDEVIEAANEADIAMIFTGMRHFRH